MKTIGKDELFWRLYVNEREFLRHYDMQQTSLSNLILVASSAVLALTLGEKSYGLSSGLAGVSLFFLGALGLVHSRKFYVEILRHAKRSHAYLMVCAREVTEEAFSDIARVKDSVDDEILISYRRVSKFPLNMVWRFYHGTLAIVGVLFMVQGVYSWVTGVSP